MFSYDKIDINNSNINQLKKLPLTEEKNILIHNYLNNYGAINSVYDLLQIKEIDKNDFELLKESIIIKNVNKIKPHIELLANFNKDPKLYLDSERYKSLIIKNNYEYNAKRLLNGGSMFSQSNDEYQLDNYYNPNNINKITFMDIATFQNVSPMDALAIMLQKDRGEIKGSFQLKNSPGISYYGYKNLLKYVDYSDSTNPYTFRMSFISTITPSVGSSSDDIDEVSDIGVVILDKSVPYTLSKASLVKNIGNSGFVKLGLLRQNNLGDPTDIYNKKFSLMLKKYFSNSLIDNGYIKAIVGNFSAAFSNGVVFDSRDTYNRNRTGYKFDKRKIGIYSDMSTGHAFTLNGFAIEGSLANNISGTFFYSKNHRDAVINQDGSFSSIIVLENRLGYGYSNNTSKIYENMIDALEEVTYGGNITFNTKYDKTRFGINMYESLYDRALNPQFLETIIGGDDPEYSGDDRYLNYYSNSADSELESLYQSSSEPSKSLLRWDKTAARRQVTGLEFSHVMGKMCMQFEYGELNYSDDFMKLFDGDPNAYIFSSFIKFDTFDFIMLYRDYDIEYDNPYQRSFSEYQFGKTTILEDSYWLEDPIFENLYSNNPKPQAEKGLYIESRYQFHKTLTGSIEYDVWTRKADEANYFNIVTKLNWNPLFNYRIKFRYKWKGRGIDNIHHPSPFYSREARIAFNLRLSNFNSMELLYNWSSVSFNPKPRLVYNSNSFIYEMSTGSVGDPDHSLGVSFSHNFDDALNVKFGVLYAGGFMWYVRDDDFLLLGDPQTMTWVSFNYAPEEKFSLKFALSYSSKNPNTTVYTGQTDSGFNIDNPFSYDENVSYKIQLDYVL